MYMFQNESQYNFFYISQNRKSRGIYFLGSKVGMLYFYIKCIVQLYKIL